MLFTSWCSAPEGVQNEALGIFLQPLMKNISHISGSSKKKKKKNNEGGELWLFLYFFYIFLLLGGAFKHDLSLEVKGLCLIL